MDAGISSPVLQEKVLQVFGNKPLPAGLKDNLEFLLARSAHKAGGPDNVTLAEVVGLKKLLEGMAF